MFDMQQIPALSQNIILLKPELQDQEWLISTHSSKTPFRISESMGKLLIWISKGCIDSSFPFLEDDNIDEGVIKGAINLLHTNNLVTLHSSHESALSGPKYHLTICRSLEERMKLEDIGPPTSRIAFKSLFEIQWRIFNNSKDFRWVEYITTPILIKLSTISFLFFGIIGLGALIFKWNLFFESISTSISGIDFLWLLLSFFLIVSIHELCHGGLLVYYGGKIKSMGVMLLYFSPAFFCDVTNGWYLPRKSQRVFIALAGVLSTFGFAGVFAVAFALWGNSSNLWVGVCAVYLYFGVLLNLIPFVRFDGYIALMAALDESHLRNHAMKEWKLFVFQVLSGQWSNISTRNIIRTIYGICCSLTPIIFLLIPFFSQVAPTTWFSWGMSVIISLFT